jgi:hypothetical protein
VNASVITKLGRQLLRRPHLDLDQPPVVPVDRPCFALAGAAWLIGGSCMSGR